MRARSGTLSLACALVAALAAPAARADTVTVGETTLTPNAGSLDGLSLADAPVFQGDAGSEYVLSSPQTGTITSWSFLTATSAAGNQFKLRVLRPASGDGTQWTAVATSDAVSVPLPGGAGNDELATSGTTSIPIQAGDRIALQPETDGSTPIEMGTSGTDGVRWFSGPFADGSTATISSGTSDPGQIVPIQATVTFTPGGGPAPPAIAITTPTNGATYAQGQAVNASYSCTPAAGTSLSSCAGPVANGAPIDTSTSGTHTFTVNATDADGGHATAASSYNVGSGSGPAPFLQATSSPTTVGKNLTISAAGSNAASYQFQLGTGAGAQTTTCPGQLPVLSAVVTRPVTTTATVTATSAAGATASVTIPISVGAASLPAFKLHSVPRRAVSAAANGASLGTVGVVAFECLPAGGVAPSPKRAMGIGQLRAAVQAPVSADPQLPACARDLKIGIIDGLGCFVPVDASNPLPAAEAKLLCAHQQAQNFKVVFPSGCNSPVPLFALALGSATRAHSAQAGCTSALGAVGYDQVYSSTQPVSIDGLEIDPVGNGVLVLARSGVDCTSFTRKDSAYLLSSDAVVKVGGLPITLHVPDYGAAYSSAQSATNCASGAATGISNGDVSGLGCLSSITIPPVSLDGHLLPQLHGPINLSVSPSDLGIELGEFQIPDNVLPLPVLPSLPLSGKIKVSLTGKYSASAAIHVELPGLLSDGMGHGLTGDTTLSLDNVHGLELNDLDIKVPSLAQVGLARLRDLEFHYKQPSLFDSMGTIDLSDVINGFVKIHLVINKSRFQSGEVTYFGGVGGGLPLFGPLYLTQLSTSLTLNPVHIHGDTQISVGPSVTNKGCGSLGIHGTADLVFGNPWTLDTTGQASVLCADLGPSKIFHADSDGHFSYGEHFNFSIPGLGSVDGNEFGQAYAAIHDPLHGIQPGDELDVQLDGSLSADISIGLCHDFGWPAGQQCVGPIHFNPAVTGTLAVGYRGGRLVGGAGVCASLGVNILGANIGFDVGAGVNDLPTAILALGTDNFPALASRLEILADNCNVSRWRLLPPPPGFSRRAHGAQAAPYTFSLPGGQSMAVVGIQGSGGAADVLLTSPSGKRIQATTDGINIDDGALVVRQPSTGQTLIEIPNAQAGTWTVQSQPGTPAVKMVETAQVLPAPVIRTSVSGRGRTRTLHYRVTPQPGLSVRFLEGVDGGATPIGAATRANGKIRFTPALGSARPRTIIAYLERNGNPAPGEIVGHYNPGTLRPGRASRVAIRHTRGGWRISWQPGALATAQQLTIRFADGVQVLLAARGAQRALTLSPHLYLVQPIAVQIVALRGQTRGKPATALVRRKRRR
jgi:hypothetical protein